MDSEAGKIITFYSYKGGTGRSMALANVAYILATQRNKKVLMIDWDLEAPGLYRYFEDDFARKPGVLRIRKGSDESLEKARGLTEYLEAAARSYRERFPDGGLPESQAHTEQALEIYEEVRRKAEFDKYVLPVGEIANLFLLKAGLEDADYPNRVRKFDWETFYLEYGSFFTHFRRHLMEEYDYVLIDSRTGLTDTSGICTRVMPEKLVGVFAPNRQNIEGLVKVIQNAAEHRRSSRDGRGLVIFPLASRIDATVSRLRTAWWKGGTLANKKIVGYQQTFEELFIELFDLDEDECKLHDYFDATQIPHDSDYAYGEAIAARVGTGDKLSIGAACANLTERLVVVQAPWEPLPDLAKLSEAQRLSEKSSEEVAQLKYSARRTQRLVLALSGVVLIMTLSLGGWWLSGGKKGPEPGKVFDEARTATRTASSFRAADEDYFHDMDRTNGVLLFSADQIKGRNTWLVWTGGDDRLWDKLSVASFGALDLLKTISSHQGLKASRDNRWSYLGLVNEPCFEKARGLDPGRFGLWLDKRNPGCPTDPFENETKYPGVKIGARGATFADGKKLPVGSFYGYATGVVGLRLFPNPDFDEAAEKKWNAERYYDDPTYYKQKDLIKPYRVGMSCAFCHVGPNPINPPDDPENPKWENLSSNVGAQYFWIDRIFDWDANPADYIFQMFHSSRPGTLDTSLVSTDNINNPRTMNAMYSLWPRFAQAKQFGKETLSGGALNNKQFNDYVPGDSLLAPFFTPPATVLAPRVLKDASDSVGVLGALNRVYLNIGLFSEEWLLHFKPLTGGKKVTPIEVAVAENNSSYWGATETQTPNMALFLLSSTTPHKLKDAPGGDKYLAKDPAVLKRGREVFAENCARCHSSKLPKPDQPKKIYDSTGCAGPDYLQCWDEYWTWSKSEEFKTKMRAIVEAPDFLGGNFLAAEFRVPITLLQTNACSALATNAIRGNIWDNFSSETFKTLPSVGTIKVYDPITGDPQDYVMPAGGRGYTRPASLISLWSTAPFLLNNSVGRLNPAAPNDDYNPAPSVENRMAAFDDSIEAMLWLEKRDKDFLLQQKFAEKHIADFPGVIDRTTQISYIRIPSGYLPESFAGWGSWLFPSLFDDGGLQLGPIPRDTPVGLFANLSVLSESSNLTEQVKHDRDLKEVIFKIKGDLATLGPRRANESEDAYNNRAQQIFTPLVPRLMSLSKCPDYIVNRGHYFGTGYDNEPALSDADKRALIEFLKTF